MRKPALLLLPPFYFFTLFVSASIVALPRQAVAQQPAAQQAPAAQKTPAQPTPDAPLHELPYSPSLDLRDMDQTADPCADFYQYSCGGWVKNNPIPPDQSGWSVYAKLTQDNQRLLWGILLDAGKATNRNSNQQKIGDYFAACMDQAAIDRRGLEPIAPELKRIAELRNVAGLTPLIASLQQIEGGTYASGAFFFDDGPTQEYADAEKVIVGVDAGGLGLPDRDYYTRTDAKSEEIRKRYVSYIAQILTMSGEPAAKADADAASIMRIETTLAKASLTRVAKRDPHNLDHLMTVSQLSELDPKIDWSQLLAANGAGSGVAVNVSEPEFMRTVNAVLAAEPIDTVRAYLRFHLVSSKAAALSHDFEQASFDFNNKFLRGTPEMRPRWKRCVAQVDHNLSDALGQEFVRLYFGEDMKAKTLVMTNQVEAAMEQEIKGLDWMSEPTKQQAIVKLHAVRNKIGYPDKWRDYSTLEIKPEDHFGNVERSAIFESKRQWAKVGKPLDRTEWDMPAPTVNAYYNPQMNDINFPAGVLQPPLYDAKLDDAPNYGDTGGTIGHELTHGFDDNGRQFDSKGNLKDWWTKEDADKFEDRINCIRNQYSSYTAVDDIKINGKLTSGEDVADLGGLILAHIAWQNQTAGEKLVPIDGFTPEQRFFVGYAQWACEDIRIEQKRVYALTDEHSPGKYRVNGLVVNMPEFKEAFGCKVGQPMVTEKICKVW